MKRLALSLGSLALLVSACGNGDEPSPEAGIDPGETTPACSDVWVDGETLPEDYEGCLENADLIAAAVFSDCADGSQLTSYDGRFYGLLGSEITEVEGEMAADRGYKKAFYDCRP